MELVNPERPPVRQSAARSSQTCSTGRNRNEEPRRACLGRRLHPGAFTAENAMPNQFPPRMSPLLPPEWDAEVRDAMSVFPSARDFVLSHHQSVDSRGVNGVGII